MLTKTEFITFLDAPLHLWAKKNNKLEDVVPSRYEQHIMQQGQQVEKIAKEYLRARLAQHNPDLKISTEQTFTAGHFGSRVDLLAYDPDADAYDIYEIKSSSSIKKAHLLDVTFQRLVCEANFTVRDVYLVHLSKAYVRQGDFNTDEFFEIVNVNTEIAERRDEVLTQRDQAWAVATSVSPDEIAACVRPKVCPCPSLCHPNLPAYPIYNLPRLSQKKARELKAMGVLAIKDIPEDYKLSDKQTLHMQAVKQGDAIIDVDAIRAELANLSYPLYFLDYETYNPAVPDHDGYKPYQHMVFQYSLHVFAEKDSDPAHYEFLAVDKGDPGIKLVEHLAEHIGDTGSVIVWNKGFEAGRNKEMAAMYPEYSDMLLNINDRIYDLMDVFAKGYYVHPDFYGSASIKNVLPVLVKDKEINYDGLPIPAGDEAMMAWVRIMEGLPEPELEETKEALLRYCELDTMAMVKNWEVLRGVVGGMG